MPPNLPPLGTCVYNGYTFNERTQTTEYRITPNVGEDGRTVVTRTLTLALTTYLSATTTTDPQVAAAVEALSKPGGILVYRGRGLGAPDINTGRVFDVAWGPTPGPIALTVVGAGRGVKLSWSVTAKLPPCADAYSQFDLMEFAFTVTVTPDEAGFRTRTIAGFLRVPLTRVAGQTLPADCADLYRDRIAPRRIKGFLRTYNPWVLSEDRTRLDFGFVDTELPGPPLPPEVIACEASETLRSSQVGLQSWEGTINASYRLMRGGDPFHAAKHFMELLYQRCRQLQDRLLALPNSGDVIPTSIEFGNPGLIGKPAANFAAGFTFTVPLVNLIAASGIWRAVRMPQYSWDAWETSIADATSPYGTLNLRFLPADDVQVSLCHNNGQVRELIGGQGAFWASLVQTREQHGTRSPAREQSEANLVSTLAGTAIRPPPPHKSYIAYENEIFAEFDSGVVPITKLPAVPLDGTDDIFGKNNDFAGRPWSGVGQPTLPPWFPVPSGTLINQPLNYMRRTYPACYLYMRGFAIRAGYPVDPPRLVDVNRIEPIPSCRFDRGEGFGRKVQANGGVPIHMTKWNIRYWLPLIPEQPMPVPSNPTMGAI